MSKIINSGLDQYGAEPFEQQQFGTAGVEGVKGLSEQNRTLCEISTLIRNGEYYNQGTKNFADSELHQYHIIIIR